MYDIREIIDFLKDLAGSNDIKPESDILKDIHLTGDDFHKMIDKFSKKFSVDMSSYIWYFHADEEGDNFGGLFIKSPYDRVVRIPVTPTMLTNFANKGKWDIQYPDHKISKRRYDLLMNKIFVGLVLTAFIVWLIFKFIK